MSSDRNPSAGDLPQISNDFKESLDSILSMLKIIVPGLYFSPELVDAALAPRTDGRKPKVLDVGTASGTWAIEMAQKFPHAEVVGTDFDLTPRLKDSKNYPANCKFEVADSNDMSRYGDGSFDVVHCRMMHARVRDFNGLLYDLAKALRPDGILLLVSSIPIVLRHPDGTPFPLAKEGEEGFTWHTQWWSTIYKNPLFLHWDTWRYWAEWLAANPNYKSVKDEKKPMRLGPHREGLTPDQDRLVDLIGDHSVDSCKELMPLVTTTGVEPAEAARWAKGVIAEAKNPPFEGYIEFLYASAVRKDGDWVAREGPAPNVRLGDYYQEIGLE